MPPSSAKFPWPQKYPVLGTGVSLAGKDEVVNLVSLWLKLGKKRAVMVTANAEILLWAKEHPSYQKLLNTFPLVTVDGFGVFCALFWHKILLKPQPSVVKLWQLRFTGRQLLEDVCRLAPQKNWRIFLLGGQDPQVAQKAAEFLKARYSSASPWTKSTATIKESKIQIRQLANQDQKLSSSIFKNSKPGCVLSIDSYSGPKDVNHETKGEWQETKKRINAFRPDFLFIAFSYPKPEEWLAKHAKNLDFGVALGIGGVFNEIVGYRKAAPGWVNRLGLESYWRLLTEPHRLKRILRALIKFPLAVVFTNR